MKMIDTLRERERERESSSLKNRKGITLIALVITIIVLLILAGVTLAMVLGDNGIINRAKLSKEENEKSTATETINFKITNVQMMKYSEEKRMPTLKELADNFCEDNDFQYVQETSEVGSLTKITNNNPTSIYTKLKAYPYEFEINSSLQLASIDGVDVSSKQEECNHISELISDFEPEIVENDAFYIKVKVPNTISSQAKGFIYCINGNVSKVTEETEYTFLNLSKNTKYTLSIIAIDQFAKIKESIPKDIITLSATKVLINSIGANNGTYAAKDYYSSSWQPYYAFDGNNNTTWGSRDGSIKGNWIKYTFNEAIYLEKIRILNRTEGGYYITSCDLQVSNDDFATYKTISEIRNLTQSQDKTIDLNLDEAYTGYRLYINSSSGTIGVGIRAFDIYGHKYVSEKQD